MPEVSLFQPIENDFYDRYDLQDPQDPYDLPFLSSLDDAFPGKWAEKVEPESVVPKQTWLAVKWHLLNYLKVLPSTSPPFLQVTVMSWIMDSSSQDCRFGQQGLVGM